MDGNGKRAGNKRKETEDDKRGIFSQTSKPTVCVKGREEGNLTHNTTTNAH